MQDTLAATRDRLLLVLPETLETIEMVAMPVSEFQGFVP